MSNDCHFDLRLHDNSHRDVKTSSFYINHSMVQISFSSSAMCKSNVVKTCVLS